MEKKQLNEKMVEALKEFKAAGIKVLNTWQELDYDSFISLATKYPFENSFDEEIDNIDTWVNTAESLLLHETKDYYMTKGQVNAIASGVVDVMLEGCPEEYEEMLENRSRNLNAFYAEESDPKLITLETEIVDWALDYYDSQIAEDMDDPEVLAEYAVLADLLRNKEVK